jgi:hypothetical protein
MIDSFDERRAFRDRFRHPEWNRFLLLVTIRLGSGQFRGVMEPFRRYPHLIVRTNRGLPHAHGYVKLTE